MNTSVCYVIRDAESNVASECFSLSQAMAIAHIHGLDPAVSIMPRMTDQMIITFASAEEVISDLLRNRAVSYRREESWGEDEVETAVSVLMDAEQAVHWIMHHLRELDLMSYSFNPANHTGFYSFLCGVAHGREVYGVKFIEIS